MRAVTHKLAFALLAAASLLCVTALAQPSPGSQRAYVIVVHPSNPKTSVDRAFVSAAFLKRVTLWDHGGAIAPVDLAARSPTRRRFAEEVLGRSVSAVRSYWQQMVFSGRGLPPIERADEADVVRYVATHPGAIGYVSPEVDLRGTKSIPIR